MAKLTRQQIEEYQTSLLEWHSPDTMIEMVRQISCQMDAEAFFNQTGINFLREAWVAGRFAKARAASYVRLVHPDPPDFMICINGAVENFELVEADTPGRRRGMEYRGISKESPALESYDADDWTRDKLQIPISLRKVVHKKLKKKYHNNIYLLIYLNISSFGLATPSEIKDVEATLITEVSHAGVKFGQIWVFWDGRMYQVV